MGEEEESSGLTVLLLVLVLNLQQPSWCVPTSHQAEEDRRTRELICLFRAVSSANCGKCAGMGAFGLVWSVPPLPQPCLNALFGLC